jgi:hypothetical protein
MIDPQYLEILRRRAADPKELYYIRGAGHNETWIVEWREYGEKLFGSFNRGFRFTSSTSS